MEHKIENTFHNQLRAIIDDFVEKTYKSTRQFPKDELFGVTSQLRRAALSVALNYVEGYARGRKAVLKNFLEISYGSLKESEYLIQFSQKQGYMIEKESQLLLSMADKIGRMIYGILKKMD